jgi:hypothetical protein
MLRYDSWPAVSQISSLAITPPPRSIERESNSTPIVMSWFDWKFCSVNCSMIDDLPT